jgi:hypothetical protein
VLSDPPLQARHASGALVAGDDLKGPGVVGAHEHVHGAVLVDSRRDLGVPDEGQGAEVSLGLLDQERIVGLPDREEQFAPDDVLAGYPVVFVGHSIEKLILGRSGRVEDVASVELDRGDDEPIRRAKLRGRRRPCRRRAQGEQQSQVAHSDPRAGAVRSWSRYRPPNSDPPAEERFGPRPNPSLEHALDIPGINRAETPAIQAVVAGVSQDQIVALAESPSVIRLRLQTGIGKDVGLLEGPPVDPGASPARLDSFARQSDQALDVDARVRAPDFHDQEVSAMRGGRPWGAACSMKVRKRLKVLFVGALDQRLRGHAAHARASRAERAVIDEDEIPRDFADLSQRRKTG